MTVTPGVVVVSVAEIPVALAQPLFFNATFRLTHSSLLMTPLPFLIHVVDCHAVLLEV